ncbi:cation:proton antiporter [Candidatus Uhrbacteria bacterium]|nr:cation:proton antiporter [Candidatus Uhrbacteria bacterium]
MNVFFEIASILVITVGISWLMQKLKQPLVLAYVVTGFVVGPAVLGLLHSYEIFELLSKLGVTALLFIVGLSLSPKVVKDVGPVSMAAGLGQIGFTALFGFLIAMALGYSWVASVYIALALTFSSTIIMLKHLQDRHELGTLYGRISTGILLVQDLAAVFVLVVLTVLSSGAGNIQVAGIVLVKALLLAIFVAFAARVVLPAMTKSFAASQEFLLIFSIAWGAGVAALFQWAGFSIEMGALAAGVALSTSPYHFEISSKMKVLRDFFVAIFFIILGAGLSFEGSSNLLWPTLLLSVFVLIGNPFIMMVIMGVMGYSRNVSFRTGIGMAQISEFSLVLAVLALQLGHINREVVSLITLVGVCTIAVSSYMLANSDRLYDLLKNRLSIFERKQTKPEYIPIQSYEAILFGCHRLGKDFVPFLRKHINEFVIVDYDPAAIDDLKRQGIPAQYGDAGDHEFIEELDFHKMKLLVTTIPDLETNRHLTRKLRKESPKGIAIVMAHAAEEAILLYDDVADYVILPPFLGGNYASLLLERYGFDRNEFTQEKTKHLDHLQKRSGRA